MNRARFFQKIINFVLILFLVSIMACNSTGSAGEDDGTTNSITTVGNPSVDIEVTGSVFLKALEGLPTYESSGRPFLAWLYRIAYARIVDHWRQQERRTEVPLVETLPARGLQPDEVLEAEADWNRAMELVAQLTDDQQDVLILRFIGEMSLNEVAETLGKTLGATKALQHRALAALARMLERQGGPQ